MFDPGAFPVPPSNQKRHVEGTQERLREAHSQFERLVRVLSQADTELIATLDRLRQLRQELSNLIASRIKKEHWSTEEFARYVGLATEERRAHRHYLATRNWHEAALRRLRQALPAIEPLAADDDREPG